MIAKLMVLFTLTLSAITCGQPSVKTDAKTVQQPSSNVNMFVNNFEAYEMAIQAAGVASIPEAAILENGDLYVVYAYTSGGENRKGNMTLADQSNNRFEGHWKTDADNGNSYQGTLYVVFDASGNGKGYYQFGGQDYEIAISKKDN